MSGYWVNILSNQPGGVLQGKQYPSYQACIDAQKATGSIAYPDQCVYVDTTPALEITGISGIFKDGYLDVTWNQNIIKPVNVLVNGIVVGQGGSIAGNNSIRVYGQNPAPGNHEICVQAV